MPWDTRRIARAGLPRVPADRRGRGTSRPRCRVLRGSCVASRGAGASLLGWILDDNTRVEGDALEVNRAWWDGAAAIHGDDPIYDSDALIAGADWLGEEEQMALTASVGSVDGLDVIHVQCHIGFDTISLARRGARVTGLDFSPAALAKAQDLARRSGVEATWVQADAARIPADLHGRFDLAYATIGAISWIEDLPDWMHAVAATLRPGGRLVLVEVHPLLTMVAEREPRSHSTSPTRSTDRTASPSQAPMPTPVPNFPRARPSTSPTVSARRSPPRSKLACGSTRSPNTWRRANHLVRQSFRVKPTAATGSASTDSPSQSSSRCWRPSSTADPATGSSSPCADTRRGESRSPPWPKLTSTLRHLRSRARRPISGHRSRSPR